VLYVKMMVYIVAITPLEIALILQPTRIVTSKSVQPVTCKQVIRKLSKKRTSCGSLNYISVQHWTLTSKPARMSEDRKSSVSDLFTLKAECSAFQYRL